MSKKQGPPKHQNQFAWKPHAGCKINETEVGGKWRPLSEITGVCHRCKDQIDWKRRYGKYKALSEPAKCQGCSKRAVRQAYHNLCTACAKEQNVCAKCRCSVRSIIGRDVAEVEAEQKMLDEAIKNSRERDRRSLIRAMNKNTTKSSPKVAGTEGNKVGDLFPSASLEDYASKSRSRNHDLNNTTNDLDDNDAEDDDDDDDDDDNDGDDGENNEAENEHNIDHEDGISSSFRDHVTVNE
ncbi:hypothetical protein M5689_007431 [Euphorbia peplus]|nr:hypothetical protein M5689_007431 [Euphorbia peplus]